MKATTWNDQFEKAELLDYARKRTLWRHRIRRKYEMEFLCWVVTFDDPRLSEFKDENSLGLIIN